MNLTETDACPCCSGKTFGECCLPVLDGKRKAATAEELMRARYSAYASGKVDFLRTSAIKSVRDEYDRESAENWSKSSRWHRLEIIATEGGREGDAEGVVEFRAEYTTGAEFCNHHERAEFVFKKKKGWLFKDGTLVKDRPLVRTDPKIGRNDPCPCGSGKKYKKCCGAR